MSWKAPARQLPLILAALVCVLGCLPRAGMEDLQRASEDSQRAKETSPALDLQCFEISPPTRGVLVLEGDGQVREEDERVQALRCSSTPLARTLLIAEGPDCRILRILESGCLLACMEPVGTPEIRDSVRPELRRVIFSPDPREDEPDPFPLDPKLVKPVPER